MAALTEDRARWNLFPPGVCYARPLAADQVVHQGAIMVLNTLDGFWYVDATGATDAVHGVSAAAKNSTGLADGEIDFPLETGTFGYFDSATGAGDVIDATKIGNRCYRVDSNTVALTSGTNTRPDAGLIYDFKADEGVIVQFEESKP